MSKKCGSIKKSSHGKTRARQRVGLTNNQLTKQLKRVYNYGITYSDSAGNLKKWLFKIQMNYPNAIPSYYANQMWIISKQGVLITVLNPEQDYETQLYKNVKSYKIWDRYKNHRKGVKKNDENYQQKVAKERPFAISYFALARVYKYLRDINMQPDSMSLCSTYHLGILTIWYDIRSEFYDFQALIKDEIQSKFYTKVSFCGYRGTLTNEEIPRIETHKIEYPCFRIEDLEQEVIQ